MEASIYIYTKFENSEKEVLKQKLSNNYVLFFHDELLENMQFDAFKKCAFCLGNVPLDWCKSSENLKWLQLHSAGIDPYNTLVNPSFIITNLRGYFAESVAETTIAGILAFYRGIDRLNTLQLDNEWVGNVIRPSLQLLHRKKVWVLGGGSIANKFISLIQPYNCEIVQSTLRELKANAHSVEYFQKMGENVDILVYILPELPELKHHLRAETLSLLNANTLVVNTGRGSSINTSDLIDFLQKKQIRGAVLDVTEQEPLPVDNPLWKMENVILTQHSAGGWEDENIGKVNFFTSQLKKYELGNVLENLVDCERGY